MDRWSENRKKDATSQEVVAGIDLRLAVRLAGRQRDIDAIMGGG